MIEFKRLNLCPESNYPLYVYDSIDEHKPENVLDQLDARNFRETSTGKTHTTLRICKHMNKWTLRATGNEFAKLDIVKDDFKTKKAAIEYVNKHYVNREEK